MKIYAPIVRSIVSFANIYEKRAFKKLHLENDSRFRFDIPYTFPYEKERRFSYFRAEGSNRKNKLMIDIHGGGYLHGNRKNNYAFAKFFCDSGFDVILPDYRLVNVHKGRNVESEIRDLLSFLVFLSDNLKKYELEEDVYLVGDSAGGHFALLLSEILSSNELKQKWGIETFSFPIKGVLLNCPVYDFVSFFTRYKYTKAALGLLYGFKNVDLDFIKSLSPCEFVSSISVPVFISSAKWDFISDHAKKLHEDLLFLGKEHQFVFIEKRGFRITHIHNLLYLNSPASKKVNDAMIKFMNEH